MKRILFLFFILFYFFVLNIDAQEEINTDCPNLNSFLQNENIFNLQCITDTIYPFGTMLFDMSLAHQYNGIDDVLELIGIDNGTTFEMVGTYKSQFEDSIYTLKYQQYHEGILVDGGGYSIKVFNGNGGDDPGNGPCDPPHMLVPEILTDIDISLSPSINRNNLENIIKNRYNLTDDTDINIESKLVISHNINQNCEYLLIWQTSFYIDNEIKEDTLRNTEKVHGQTLWIDAQSGEILKTLEFYHHIVAPTGYIYGDFHNYQISEQLFFSELDDTKVGNTVFLYNDLVRIHDVGPDLSAMETVKSAGWTITNYIPRTNKETWPGYNEYNGIVYNTKNDYQTFYVCNKIMPDIKELLNVDFGRLEVCVYKYDGAFAYKKSEGNSISSPHIGIGQLMVSDLEIHPRSLYDIIGHEVGHIFLDEFLDAPTLQNGAIHEAIADMIGLNIKWKQDHYGWQIGSDDNLIANKLRRNLSNPDYPYLTEYVLGCGDKYKLCQPIGYMYYLLTKGNTASQINGFGTDKALDIILESVKTCQLHDDIDKFRERMISYVAMKYGNCSVEMKSVMNTWNKIGLYPKYTGCNITFNGPTSVCEESNRAKFCVDSNFPGIYRWRIDGPNCTEFKSECGMNNSNTQNGCSCLSLIQFPTFDFYPQTFKLTLYYTSVNGVTSSTSKTLRINDCDGDDPTCEEFFNSIGNRSIIDTKGETNSDVISKIKIIDIMGKTIYEGSLVDLENIAFYKRFGVLIVLSYDESGKLLKSEKVLNKNKFK